jgi:hypothetical protein
LRQDQASDDLMAELSKWLEAGEESIVSLETEKNLPGASYELPEPAVGTKNFRETKSSRRLVEFRSGRSSLCQITREHHIGNSPEETCA